MKSTIIVFIFVLYSIAGFSQRTDYIQIEHVGESDVPIFILLIETQKLVGLHNDDMLFEEPLILDIASFLKLKQFIEKYNYANGHIKYKAYEYGTFEISIGSLDKNNFIPNKKFQLSARIKSKAFLNDFLKYCEKNNLNKDISE